MYEYKYVFITQITIEMNYETKIFFIQDIKNKI